METMEQAARDLDAGRVTSRALVEGCLGRIADPAGEGARTFVAVYAEAARASADAADALRRAGRAPGPWCGVPVSVKDLFDVAGEVTRAGSQLLAGAAPAEVHAAVVRRLLAAGLVLVGRTNMTEFAYSGLGINPHFGTPRSPWDQATGRIPGGSSSGAAVSVANGMAVVAVGTDTGGSCRIPAAFCGVAGFKPTARRVPTDGAFTLSPTLDSVGPLGVGVACCAALDGVMAGEDRARLPRASGPGAATPEIEVAGLRLGVVEGLVLEGMDGAVAAAWERALARLGAAGARLVRVQVEAFAEIGRSEAGATLVSAEAHAVHRERLRERGEAYDPQVRARLLRGAGIDSAAYLDALAVRVRLRQEADAASAGFDALLMPTVAVVAPTVASLADEAEYVRVNALVLRNTALANFLDRCAISVPCQREGEAGVGLMLVGETMGDRRLLAVAAAVEGCVRG